MKCKNELTWITFSFTPWNLCTSNLLLIFLEHRIISTSYYVCVFSQWQNRISPLFKGLIRFCHCKLTHSNLCLPLMQWQNRISPYFIGLIRFCHCNMILQWQNRICPSNLGLIRFCHCKTCKTRIWVDTYGKEMSVYWLIGL